MSSEHDLLAAFSAGHVVGVLERLVGHERHVRAADDHGDAARAQTVGELIGSGRRGRGARDADQIGAVHVFPVDGRHLRAIDEHVVAVPLEGRGDDRQAEARQQDLGPDVHPGWFWLDKTDFHASLEDAAGDKRPVRSGLRLRRSATEWADK